MSRLRDIADAVAERHGLTLGEMRGRSQERRVAWPRQEAFSLLMDTGAFSPNRIGLYFDRDRNTVIVGVRHHRERLERATAELSTKAVHGARMVTVKSPETVHA